jgi:pyruvate/oxaloacetate carboxyltransferase
MNALRLAHVALRDARQSLGATRMTTPMMLPIAPAMDAIGFEAIDLMGAVAFDLSAATRGRTRGRASG